VKLLIAIIGPERLSAVQAAAGELGAEVLSVSQVVGNPREPGFTEIYRGRQIEVPRPKLRVELVVHDAAVAVVVAAIRAAASAGNGGAVGRDPVLVMQLEPCATIPVGPAAPGADVRHAAS
jgi:nitrogen regulatory protein PII